MHTLARRDFLAASAGGFAAALTAGPALLAAPRERELAPSPRPWSGLDTLFLTWSGDPTTTTTVQWVGGVADPGDSLVTFRPVGSDVWAPVKTVSAPFPLTEYTRFRAELTGLKPGTDYRFRVGRSEVEYRFRTMPAKATDSFTFVSGGDCGVNSHVVANNILAAKQDPYFAVIGGDLAYDNGKDWKATLGWLKAYSKHMVDSQGRLIPMAVCMGNHEVNGGYGKPRSAAPLFFSLFDGLFRDTSYATLDFGDYLSLVLLDTGHVSKIGGEQASWLDGALKERAERQHLIVVNHVPAYPSFRPAEVAGKDGVAKAGTGDDNRKHWVPLFERYNVDVVLEHHDHTFKRTHPLKGGLRDKNGILYLGDGSWGKLRSAAKAESRPYIAAAGTAYHLSVHRLEGDVRYHLAMEETGRVVDICTTTKKPRKRG